MSVGNFYLHALTEDRRKRFEFLLFVNQYVQETIETTGILTDSLRPKRIEKAFKTRSNLFMTCIGETVLEFMKECMSDQTLLEVTNYIMKSLRKELNSGIAVDRSDLLALACKKMTEDNFGDFGPSHISLKFYPFTSNCSGIMEAAKSYLMYHFQKYTENPLVSQYEARLKKSLFSSAIVYIRLYVEQCGKSLEDNTVSYFRFFACVCTLLLHVSVLGYDDFKFQIIGEAERVLQKRDYTYPGLAALYASAVDYASKLQYSQEKASI